MSRVISSSVSSSLFTVLLILSSLSVINSGWLKRKPKITDKLIEDVCKNAVDQDFCKKMLSSLKGKTLASSFTKSLGEATMADALTRANRTLTELRKLQNLNDPSVVFSTMKYYREYTHIVEQLARAKDAMSKGEGTKVRDYVFEAKNRARRCVRDPIHDQNSRYLIRLCDIILAICRSDPTVK